ncbi:MAG: hypothetical protein K6B28_12865 [Lachnospiraceae bacterium]|nr:hypothetical protein [Lachnospiraceae bacterium]
MKGLKSRRDIEIDFMRACRQSEELMEISSGLVKIAGSGLEDTMLLLRRSFKGNNAELFYNKAEKLKNELLEDAEELANVAGSIYAMANVVYEAEMKALEMVC